MAIPPESVVEESMGFDEMHPIVREYVMINYSSVPYHLLLHFLRVANKILLMQCRT